MHEDYSSSFLLSLYLPWLGFVLLKREIIYAHIICSDKTLFSFRIDLPLPWSTLFSLLHLDLAWKSHQPFDVKVHICDTHPQLLSWSPVQVATSSVHSLSTIGIVLNLCSWGLCLCWIFFLSMIWANQHQLLNQVKLSSFTQFSIYSL